MLSCLLGWLVLFILVIAGCGLTCLLCWEFGGFGGFVCFIWFVWLVCCCFWLWF